MKICIVGYGVIGKNIYKEITAAHNADIEIAIMEKNGFINHEGSYLHPQPSDIYDIAFIAVPTDSNPNGSTDISQVVHTIANVTAEIKVVRSAVPVTTAQYLTEKYGGKIVISPEFWGNTLHSSRDLNWVILGGDKDVCSKVAQFYYRIKPSTFRVHFTDWRTAELAKYCENVYLANKVALFAEFSIIAKKYGINYEELRECILMDERIVASHTFIYDNQPYYDSHCLNKDVTSLIYQGGGDAQLIRAMSEINEQRKKVKNNG